MDVPEFGALIGAQSGPHRTETATLKVDDPSPWRVRPDKDYGLVWIKSYGKGRVFNWAMGHTPTLFETPALAQMTLGAIQFVLGDLPADTTPSAMLTMK